MEPGYSTASFVRLSTTNLVSSFSDRLSSSPTCVPRVAPSPSFDGTIFEAKLLSSLTLTKVSSTCPEVEFIPDALLIVIPPLLASVFISQAIIGFKDGFDSTDWSSLTHSFLMVPMSPLFGSLLWLSFSFGDYGSESSPTAG